MDTPIMTPPARRSPFKPRQGEVIGGGYFVFRRGDSSGRIRPSDWPFEYDTLVAAQTQAELLAKRRPGYAFEVFARLARHLTSTEPQP